MAHQELPFDRLAVALGPHDPSRHPVFQAFFEFIVPAPVELPLPDVEVEPFVLPRDATEFDLGLYLDESFNRIDAVWEYSTDLFDPESIENLAGRFVALLEAVAAEPDRPIADLAQLGEDERERLIVEWNATEAPISAVRIEQLRGAVRRSPSFRPSPGRADAHVLRAQRSRQPGRALAHRPRRCRRGLGRPLRGALDRPARRPSSGS